MSVRSHVDPCLFVVFVHVQGEHLTEILRDAVESFLPSDGDSLRPLRSKLHPRSQQLLFHEIYHFWQGLRLPFLFRYATLSFRQMMIAFRELSRSTTAFTEWSCQLPEFQRLTGPSYLGFLPGGKLFWGATPERFPQAADRIKLTILSMLECAASVAEFQVASGSSIADPSSLRRWAKRNPAYLDLFDFVAGYLDDETLALRLILPLINAAFHTTIPERAFVELLARAWGQLANTSEFSDAFLAQPEPCRWPDLFDHFLGQLKYDRHDYVLRQFETSFYRISMEELASLTYGHADIGHPFLARLAQQWVETARESPAYYSVLDLPGYCAVLEDCSDKFSPPVTVFQFHLGGDRDRVFLEANTRAVDDYAGATFKGMIADVLTIYGAVRRASGAHFDPDQRTCHHVGCTLYQPNFCNVYPIVPGHHTSCGFPARIGRLISIMKGL